MNIEDNRGYDKFIAFGTGTGNLGISGASPNFICFGASYQGRLLAAIPQNANTCRLNKWIILSIH